MMMRGCFLLEGRLKENVLIRFFPGDKKRRARYLKTFPDRWTGDSHFVRSACLHFMHHLDNELKVRRFERRVRR